MFDAEVVRVEISLGFVVSLCPKGAAFGQAGSTRLLMKAGASMVAFPARFSSDGDTSILHSAQLGHCRRQLGNHQQH